MHSAPANAFLCLTLARFALSLQIPIHAFRSLFLLPRLLRHQPRTTHAQADALQRLYRKEQLELEYQAQYLRMARGTASASPSGSFTRIIRSPPGSP